MSDTKQNIVIRRLESDGTFHIYYPQTTVDAILTDKGDIKAHFADAIRHVTAAEKTAMSKYLVLDANARVEDGKLMSGLAAVKKEFATIALRDADTAPVNHELVMVLDATGDTTVKSGWAVYRTTVVDVSGKKTASYEKVSEKESMDYQVSWDALSDKPTSTTAQIDGLVTNDHTHANKAMLDALTDESLKRAGTVDSQTNISYGATADANAKQGDMFYQVTGTVQ